MLINERIQRIERWLTPRNARIGILGAVLVSLCALVALRNVRVDYDFEKFFPTDDPELDRYLAFRERFGHDNDFLMLGFERAGGVFDPALLARVDTLAGDLDTLPHVLRVLSPTRMEEPVVTPLGVFFTPYLRWSDTALLAIDRARIAADPRMQGTFFNADGTAMLVLLTAEPGLSKVRCDSLLWNVKDALARHGLSDARLAGRIVGQDHYIHTMVRETVTFLLLSIALLSVFLWIGFRSVAGVVVPITVVGLSILWQVGLMTALGKPLGILTMLLPTILFVVGMSDVVHILECYLDEIRKGTEQRHALARTLYETGLPTFLTALTSAIGFSTLGTASIPPLREFGLYTSIGVFVAFLLAFLLLPALLILTDARRLLPTTDKPSPWDARLPRLFQWTLRHRRGIVAAFAAITLAGSWGASRVTVNNFLLEDLPENDPMKAGFLWFERVFGGVRPFEMEVNVVRPGATVWDPEVLAQIDGVQAHLRTEQAVSATLSPATLIRSMNRAFNGGSADFDRLPEDSAEAARMARQVKLLGRELVRTLVDSTNTHARITGRMVDEGGRVHAVRNAGIDAFIRSNTDSTLVRFHQTGMAYLIDRNNATLSTQLVGGMGVAVLLTGLIMLWFFRDPRMVLVALIPNLVPLVFIAGVMGFAGIDLKVSTAIIFTISFGIAEDDTIHMLAALRQHLREGRHPLYALKRTYLATGKAVTVTSLMLLSGFVTLISSDFASIRYMGILITLTLGFAFVAELLLLPALVVMLTKRGHRK